MRSLGIAALATFATIGAQAHVRQRVYVPVGADGASGQESIIHWDPSQPVKIHMQAFSGNLGHSSLSFAGANQAKELVTSAIGEWSGDLFPGVPSGLSFDLASGAPHETTSGCETDTNKGRAVLNNIVFTTKMTASCSEALGANSGVIGLTRVLYQASTGLVVEADIQFNDLQFKFTDVPGNDLMSNPRRVYLKDVVTHELGHFFGLDHSGVRDSTMLFAVSDGLESTESDDRLGLLSLYPSSASRLDLPSLQGSVTDESGAPVFGAVVYAFDARTLRPVATEIADANGAFQFCALPKGKYAFLANRYRPLSTNIHAYYSGDGMGGARDEAGCFNPSCSLMSSALRTTLVDKDPATGTGGRALKVYDLAADASHLNIVAATWEPVLGAVPSTDTGSPLTLDEPRFAKLGDAALPAAGGGMLSTVHRYRFTAPASRVVQIRTASFRLYTRLGLSLTLREAATPEVDATSTLCPGLPTADPTDPAAENTLSAAYGVDPWIECDDLTAGQDYVLQIAGTPVACNEVPGNGSNCATTASEPSSVSLPYYAVTVFDPSVGATASASFDATSGAAASFTGLPACGAYSSEVLKAGTKSPTEAEEKTGACCGTIRSLSGGGPPDGPKTWLLTLALSPVFWFVIWWSLWPRRRAFQVTSFRARKGWLGAWREFFRRKGPGDRRAGADQANEKMLPSAKR